MEYGSTSVKEIDCRGGVWRGMCGVTQRDRFRNEGLQRTTVARDLADQAEQEVLRVFGHVERMEEGHLVKKTRSNGRSTLDPRLPIPLLPEYWIF